MPGKLFQKEHKSEIVKRFARAAGDTGSPEVQVALMTDRINELNMHFKANPNDKHSKVGLMALVGQRKQLLAYLKREDVKRYNQLIQSLELRK